MSDPRKLTTEAFDYHLPEERIAKYPIEQRDQSRLLVYHKGQIQDDRFINLAGYIPSDCIMVYNNAEVVYARLAFRKRTGAWIEVFCLEPSEPAEYARAFAQTESVAWTCLVGNLKKWKSGALTRWLDLGGGTLLKAQMLSREQQYVKVRFEWNNPRVSFGEILENSGKVPIPPYLKRESEEIDKARYQTLYSRIKGSVAAPTAGLHFTPRVFRAIRDKGISSSEITLHVGAGTFRPVKTERVDQHAMHMEYFSVSGHTLEQLIENHPNILAVGTTSMRTLESLYWLGVLLEDQPHPRQHLQLGQWQHLEHTPHLSPTAALKNIQHHLKQTGRETLQAGTRMMITPGYPFQMTRGLVTNFHQPKSTLLMLVAAFVGDDWKKIYQYALAHGYRFLSYGDASLLMPK